MNEIFDYLDELFESPKGELNYNSDVELLIATLLSAQTTDKKVNKVTEVLFKNTILEISNMNIKDIEEILKPLGMYNKKAQYVKNVTTTLLEKYNGKVPNNRKELMTLSGVGRKTANLVLSVLYNEPFIAVDTHILRVSKRLNMAKPKDNALQVENKLYKIIPKDRMLKTHHQLVLFGRYKCKAIKPECVDCKLKNICNYYKKKI